jgi:hypothetical protein
MKKRLLQIILEYQRTFRCRRDITEPFTWQKIEGHNSTSP